MYVAIKCCYKCDKRIVGCHAICPEYTKEKAEYEIVKEKIKASKTDGPTKYDFDKICYAGYKRHKIK